MALIGPSGIPYFGNPPQEYSQRFMTDLVRAFAQFAALTTNPGEMRGTKIVLTDLPDGDQGLEAGTLYRDGTSVKIASNNISAPSTVALTSSLGDVIVLTP